MGTRILIKNARLLATFDDRGQELPYADLLIEGQKIIRIGHQLSDNNVDRTLDASDKLLLPGFINTHHHFYQVLTRCLPQTQNAKLFDWLRRLYPLWRHLTPEDVYFSSLAAMAELLLTGVTTTTDQHYLFPQGVKAGLIDAQVTAARELSIRFHPCRGSMSLGTSHGGLPPDQVVQTQDEILLDSQRLIELYHDPQPFSMLRIALAPCSPFSVSPELMREIRQLARQHQVLLHTHLAETLDEEQFCKEHFGLRPLEYLQQLEWLGEDVWLVHCVHLNESDIELLARTKTAVAHCPSSNMVLASGIAPIVPMLQREVRVGLAVDGSSSNDSSNMLQEVRQAMLLQRLRYGAEAMSARQALWLATRGGAALFQRPELGSLQEGKAADLALFDLASIDYAGSDQDSLAALVRCGISQRAHTVIVNGTIVVDAYQLHVLDLEKLRQEVNQRQKALLARAHQT